MCTASGGSASPGGPAAGVAVPVKPAGDQGSCRGQLYVEQDQIGHCTRHKPPQFAPTQAVGRCHCRPPHRLDRRESSCGHEPGDGLVQGRRLPANVPSDFGGCSPSSLNVCAARRMPRGGRGEVMNSIVPTGK
jgi:hypothetical protein